MPKPHRMITQRPAPPATPAEIPRKTEIRPPPAMPHPTQKPEPAAPAPPATPKAPHTAPTQNQSN